MEDGEIVLLLREREEQAIEEMKKLYGSRLLGIALAILENREDADECLSDTLWKAWKAIPPAQPVSLFAYLARICRNTALDRLDYRNSGMRKGIMLELTAELEQCIPDRMKEAELEGRELAAALNRFLEGISKEKRFIFLRRYWYGDSVAVIAERYHIGESKVKTTLFRTREKLRKFLEKEGIMI